MATTTETISGLTERNVSSSTPKPINVPEIPNVQPINDPSIGVSFAPSETHQEPATPDAPSPATKLRISLIIFQLSMINFITSCTSGVIVIALPTIASSINLPEKLYLWPSSVYGLTSGATLLLAASITDFMGSRTINLVGEFLVSLMCLACGLAQTGVELVIFRALLGIAMSLHFPSSVSILTKSVPAGKGRNIGFSCLGLSQPLGFSFGLVIGGVVADTIGWRSGFYIPGACGIVVAVAGLWTLPKDMDNPEWTWQQLWTGIDWIGAVIASACLTLLTYALAVMSTDAANIRLPSTIVMLVLSIILIPAFPAWTRRQERRGKPALISNIIWKKLPFTSICAMVLLSWAVMNGMEMFSSLFFQEIQELSSFQASLRLLPNLLFGTFVNLTTGLFVDKFPARWLVFVSTVAAAGSPLLMALIHPEWSYWTAAFFAQILCPISGDVLFTVGLLVVSDIFPENMQALAGGVFNTVAQFGISLGLSVMQVISLLVTKESDYPDKDSPLALLQGYRASFWAMFGFMILSALVSIFGLRKVGKVGLKRD